MNLHQRYWQAVRHAHKAAETAANQFAYGTTDWLEMYEKVHHEEMEAFKRLESTTCPECDRVAERKFCPHCDFQLDA